MVSRLDSQGAKVCKSVDLEITFQRSLSADPRGIGACEQGKKADQRDTGLESCEVNSEWHFFEAQEPGQETQHRENNDQRTARRSRERKWTRERTVRTDGPSCEV